jgi:uncharacterized membrane protein
MGTLPVQHRFSVGFFQTLFLILLTSSSLSFASPGGPRHPSAPVLHRITTSDGLILRGHLLFGHEVRSFQPCGTDNEYWVVDRTRAGLWDIYRALVPKPYEPLYVELQGVLGPPPNTGFGVDFDRLLTVSKLLRAAGETRGCAEDLRRFAFRAYGNEPFWNTEISVEGILFSVIGKPQLRFPLVPGKPSGGRRLYSSKSHGIPQHWIQIWIDEQRCVDSMSGEFSRFAARVSLDGRTYVGCARQGWAGLPTDEDRDPKIMTMPMLLNAEYGLDFSLDGKVTLLDGFYREKIVPGSAANLTVSLGRTAIGDLDGDDFDDAVVILISNPGGSGTFRHLAAVLNRGGAPEHVATVYLGDRIKVESLSIRSGKIEAGMLIHDAGDPMTQPTLKLKQRYELRDEVLVPVQSTLPVD